MILALVLGSSGLAIAGEGRWELNTDGEDQARYVRDLLERKRAQEAAIRDVVSLLWNVYEVHVKDPFVSTPYNQFNVPDKVQYSVPVRVSYNREVLADATRILRSKVFSRGDTSVVITMPDGGIAIQLYDEVLPVFENLSNNRQLTFICRVVLLDENQEVLGKSDSFLYAKVRDLNFTQAPWVGNFRKVSVPTSMLEFQPPNPADVDAEDAAAQEIQDLASDLNAFFGLAEEFYILEESDRVLFDYLPIRNLERVHTIRVLRPDDALLLYKGDSD